MTGYRANSKWNDLNELLCLQAYKKLEENNFPKKLLTELAKKIAYQSGLTLGSVKAKISNYKSVAGVTGHSNASQNTLSMYNNYNHLNSSEIQELMQSDKYL